ncbi:MAG: twin-arginine translocation signal domain-containing protein, partial [Acidobacteria bacterium]|nr:twin-arginine translocation signal domain-containing protein [Acidobacteriota bacterium]
MLNRRDFLRSSAAAPAALAQRSRLPNLLIVMADQQRAGLT